MIEIEKFIDREKSNLRRTSDVLSMPNDEYESEKIVSFLLLFDLIQSPSFPHAK
jgi:hypothetical protein